MKILTILSKQKKVNLFLLYTKKLIQKFSNVAPLLNILGFALHKQGNLKMAIKKIEEQWIKNDFTVLDNEIDQIFKN